MKTYLLKLTCGLTLLGVALTAPAQSTFNYFISDAGGGNSLVTWNVTGSLATSPGAIWENVGGFGGLPVQASGLYIDSYAGSGPPQDIPTLDGSFFHNTELNQNFAISLYFTANSPGSGLDDFGLISYGATTATGQHLIYNAGTESALIPVPYSDFNPGTYQYVYSAGSFFDTAATVDLTVGPVPEPTTLALAGLGGLGLLLFRRFYGRV